MKLLITSVGSLLGQNILDCIESRRSLIEVIGLDAAADNTRNFRCDVIYLVKLTDHDEFFQNFIDIVEKEKPDFILPGRDGDSIFLSDLKFNFLNKYENIIPLGNSFIPKIMLDKYESYLFSKEHKLEFADTILYNKADNTKELDELIDKHGFPLLAKPREGFGSHGVYYVLSYDHINELAKDNEILIQQYLGSAEEIEKYKDSFKMGIPLFFQVPEKEQYAAQTIISPNGTIGEVFITINTMVHGRAEYTKQIFNKDIEELVSRFSKVFYTNGWYGPVNFQLKPDNKGKWKVFEYNSRLTGTSSARAMLGYDEFGILVNIFRPELGIPNLTTENKVKGQIIKYLNDHLLLDKNADTLNKHKIWRKF